MIQATRRKFLSLLGASPIAAQQFVKEKELLDAGFSTLGNVAGGTAPSSCNGMGEDNLRLLKLLKNIGIPDWKKKEIRQAAKYNRALDPDIAALRSVSTSHKIRMQWRKNEEEITESFLEGLSTDWQRDKFREKYSITRWF